MESTSSKVILYSYWRSSCSWRVRSCLNLKNIPYEMVTLDPFKNVAEQMNAYKAISPLLQVPALQIDGHTLIESLSIMHYLEETRPDVSLLPKNAFKRAKVREICEIIVSSIQPLQNVVVVSYVGEDKEKEWSGHWILRGFHAVEKLLEKTSKTYCVGDEITFADCCLVPQVFNAKRLDLDLSCFPNILRIDKELEKHPAFYTSHPFSQPDCPNECKRK